MLNITPKNVGKVVMVKQNREEMLSSIPEELRYVSLLNTAMVLLNKDKEEKAERLKLPLKVSRHSRKTFVNICEISERLNRQEEHLSKFIAMHLHTEGSVNKEGSLVLEGSYLQSDIENALRNFIELYVVCRSCDSVDDTSIVKENKLFFLRCDKCKGSRCVGNVIEGFTLKEKVKPKLRGLV